VFFLLKKLLKANL